MNNAIRYDSAPLWPVSLPSVTLVVSRSAGDIACLTSAASTPDLASRTPANAVDTARCSLVIASSEPTLLP